MHFTAPLASSAQAQNLIITSPNGKKKKKKLKNSIKIDLSATFQIS